MVTPENETGPGFFDLTQGWDLEDSGMVDHRILTLFHRCPCVWCRPPCKRAVRNDVVLCFACIAQGHAKPHPTREVPGPKDWKPPITD